ncbi:MAG: hypothetical protein IAC13_07765 [Firmicutes bacterium]|uniref:Flagellin N-terminal domain-containing protein n=1 Tax=Candidatus Scybalomonas excrementavium TaxID=2840943 RepID=A0A9D9I2G2_9FIRM|nr:hypothetical protein [Candidatus Scybalomonas excrementavium]
MRITNGSVIRNYKSQLASSLSNLDSARMQVLTGRKFSKASENPTAAFRETQLYRKYTANQDYQDTVKDMISRQDVQENALREINTETQEILKDYLVRIKSAGITAEERKTYATALRTKQNSMLLSLNSSYEDSYVLAGGDGKNKPFTLDPTTNKLSFRGIPVTTNDATQLSKLDALANQKTYIDIGFGLSLDANGQVNSSSAFNTSLPGIKAIGYGETNGIPNNIIDLCGEIADELEKDDIDWDHFDALVTQMESTYNELLSSITGIGVQSKFLTQTSERLETEQLALTEQISNVSEMDLTEGITNYSWMQYTYNAALKVGSNIISSSLIDFMR